MIRGVIQYTRSPSDVSKELRGAVKQANARVARRWHDKWMPQHFTQKAGRRYDYQPRQGQMQPGMIPRSRGGMKPNPAYYWTKKRKKGHTRPLVWSGDAERKARRMVKISATAKRATAAMKMPGYFYAYRKDLSQPDKSAELTRVVRGEVRDLAKNHHKLVTGQLNRFRKRRTVKA